MHGPRNHRPVEPGSRVLQIIIRRAEHGDAPRISEVHSRSIQLLCSASYGQEEIRAWTASDHRTEVWKFKMDRDYLWVAEIDGVVLGFGHLAVMDVDRGEILALYIDPQASGRGLAKMLFAEMLALARELRLKFLDLHSTLNAKGFYVHLGFLQSASDTSVAINGVDIPCIPMRKELLWNTENLTTFKG